ncbi:MAG: hypothetical protein Crog4KO_13280 [Crocinitomicaceae bacterium]
MKNANKNAPLWAITMMLLVCLGLSACQPENVEVEEIEEAPELDVSSIEGNYVGDGECIQTDSTGVLSTITFIENDAISKYPGTKKGLYEVKITAGDFYEVELGALSGNVLRTATWDVADNTYPVLEEYIFDTDKEGKVIGYTKIVRNPIKENFKTCVVYGKKL